MCRLAVNRPQCHVKHLLHGYMNNKSFLKVLKAPQASYITRKRLQSTCRAKQPRGLGSSEPGPKHTPLKIRSLLSPSPSLTFPHSLPLLLSPPSPSLPPSPSFPSLSLTFPHSVPSLSLTFPYSLPSSPLSLLPLTLSISYLEDAVFYNLWTSLPLSPSSPTSSKN